MISLVILPIFLYLNLKNRNGGIKTMLKPINSLISYIEDKRKGHWNKDEETTEEQYVRMEKNLIFLLDEYLKSISYSWNIKKVYLSMNWNSRKNMLKMLNIDFLKTNKEELMDDILKALKKQIEINRIANKLMSKNKVNQ